MHPPLDQAPGFQGIGGWQRTQAGLAGFEVVRTRWGDVRYERRFDDEVAYISVEDAPGSCGHCYIAMVHVPETARRQGVATELLEAVCKWADHQGVELCLLPIPIPRWNIFDWYATFGFEIHTDRKLPLCAMVRQPSNSPSKKEME